MSTFLEAFNRALVDAQGDADAFREVVLRLLRHGVIAAKDSQRETQLYSDCQRYRDLVEDYVSLMGCRLHHDTDYKYFRLYPPGAGAPGQVGAEPEEAQGLRLKLNPDEVAAAITACFLYDKARQEGRLDEEGEVAESLETFHTAMHTALHRTLPEGQVERRAILHRLKQMKLIQYDRSANLDDSDTVIVLRPLVTSLVYPDAVNIIEAALPAGVDEDDGDERSDRPETDNPEN